MKIYCDYDSTLNTLAQAWTDWANRLYHTNITTKDILHWNWMGERFGGSVNDFWKNADIYKNDVVTVLPGSIPFIKTLQSLFGKENVFIVTHSWPGTEVEKDKQIRRKFGFINIIHEADKFRVTNDGILIDDRACTVGYHCQINKMRGIVFNNNNNYGWSVKEFIEDFETVQTLVSFKTSYEDIFKYLVKLYKDGVY